MLILNGSTIGFNNQVLTLTFSSLYDCSLMSKHNCFCLLQTDYMLNVFLQQLIMVLACEQI